MKLRHPFNIYYIKQTRETQHSTSTENMSSLEKRCPWGVVESCADAFLQQRNYNAKIYGQTGLAPNQTGILDMRVSLPNYLIIICRPT